MQDRRAVRRHTFAHALMRALTASSEPIGGSGEEGRKIRACRLRCRPTRKLLVCRAGTLASDEPEPNRFGAGYRGGGWPQDQPFGSHIHSCLWIHRQCNL
jgi:hypothetical protein